MIEKIVHSTSMDCRGVGNGPKLPERNDVSITKVLSIYGMTKRVEVGCDHLSPREKKCTLTGILCPHLHPVSS